MPPSLEEVWRQREEDIYPALFGPLSRGIFPLPAELFSEQFGQTEIDPRWLTYGVLEFAPTAQRPCWLYATSGHSNPWEQEPAGYNPAEPSGAGVEFVFCSTEAGDWAIRQLQSMLAFDILLSAGRFANANPLDVGDRIPLRAPLNGEASCQLRNLVASAAEGVASAFQLPSGQVSLIGFTAISDAELAFGKQHGSPALLDRLREAGAHPVTDPGRSSLF